MIKRKEIKSLISPLQDLTFNHSDSYTRVLEVEKTWMMLRRTQSMNYLRQKRSKDGMSRTIKRIALAIKQRRASVSSETSSE